MSDPSSPKAIIYDFAEILGQLRLPIKDERLLPHPKEKIDGAFRHYIAELELTARILPGDREELEQVRMLYMHLSDFQKIDPDDMAIVSEINAGSRFEKFRSRDGLAKGIDTPEEEEALTIFTDVVSKYAMRGAQESGI